MTWHFNPQQPMFPLSPPQLPVVLWHRYPREGWQGMESWTATDRTGRHLLIGFDFLQWGEQYANARTSKGH